MDVKKLALLIGALLMAGISAFMARSMFSGAAAPQAEAAGVAQGGTEILVATKPLPVGTIIDPDSFRYQPWPKELVQSAYYVKGQNAPQALPGTVVRYAITAGQPITQGALVKPGDRGFLAAALGPGMRAVTVKMDDATGVAGFVFPGDRVDLVLTSDVAGGGDGPPLKTSETIVRNLRVLATDQRSSSETPDGKSPVAIYSTVTMEATPKIAEKIAVAQTMGKLSLALRSIADNTAELERAVAAGEVTVPEGTDPKAEKTMLLQIASRPADTDTTYTVGGDVSRFQRRTVPGKPQNASPSQAQGPTQFANAAPAAPTVRPAGPLVRVARGNTITDVPVGGN